MQLSTHMGRKLLALVLSHLCLVSLAANPADLRVVDGQAIFKSPSENVLEIQALNGTILECRDFSNHDDETINISLPTADDILYIRVASTEPCQLLGSLNSNGALYLINYDDIIIGDNASINATELYLKGKIISHSGTIRVQKTDGQAGNVTLSADLIMLDQYSIINASGTSGGGQIHIGGGWKGQDPAIPNAQVTIVKENAVIFADALKEGSGGTVVIWSDQATTFLGNISATGRGQEAYGGLAEIASKYMLHYDGNVVLNADNGSSGTLLLESK